MMASKQERTKPNKMNVCKSRMKGLKFPRIKWPCQSLSVSVPKSWTSENIILMPWIKFLKIFSSNYWTRKAFWKSQVQMCCSMVAHSFANLSEKLEKKKKKYCFDINSVFPENFSVNICIKKSCLLKFDKF